MRRRDGIPVLYGCARAGGLCAWLTATVGTLGKGKSIDCVLALIGGGRSW